MNAVNLAIVFGMGMAPEGAGVLGINPDFGFFQSMVRSWIIHADTIFPDVPEDDPETFLAQGDHNLPPSQQDNQGHIYSIPVIVESNSLEDA